MSHRFSPRPNRAAEIEWMEWGPEAFERARATDRPILLGISAVWCHWCHVMDETTYSDQRVIDLIRERYVPVRVDNDKRPDVNARYNMGGWPTTAFLTPSGEILSGATYVPPADFVRVLDRIATVWREERDEIEKHLAERLREREAAGSAMPRSRELNDRIVGAVAEAIASTYDEVNAGFGTAPKFPQTPALRFLLTLYRIDRARGRTDERLYQMLARTALAMARGGMYDRVEGGFFRYSTTPDWTVPHFEKMAEDHAGLLRFYADLYRVSGNEAFAETLRSAMRWLRTTLRNPGSALFGGSQDADEEYFALPLDERRAHAAPYVDRTVYANWNAQLASALCCVRLALDDDTILEDATAAIDELCAQILGPGGLALHFKPEDGVAQFGPILTDQVALLDALLELHAATGAARFLEGAKRIAGATIARFRRDDGALVDHPGESALGNVRIPHRPLDENAEMADALLRLAAVTRDERYAGAARGILSALGETADRAGSFAAPYARAMLRAQSEPLVATIVARDGEGDALREAALRLPDPLVVVHTVPASEAAGLGYLESDEALAYLCAGTRCAAPAGDERTLSESYDALRQLPVR